MFMIIYYVHLTLSPSNYNQGLLLQSYLGLLCGGARVVLVDFPALFECIHLEVLLETNIIEKLRTRTSGMH